MKKISFKSDEILVEAELYETPTARAVYNLLPLIGNASTWGDEIYFNIDLQINLESDARKEVEIGDLGYWPTGPSFCIFFGRTPVSVNNKPKAYSKVNVFGRITGNISDLKRIKDGDVIIVER